MVFSNEQSLKHVITQFLLTDDFDELTAGYIGREVGEDEATKCGDPLAMCDKAKECIDTLMPAMFGFLRDEFFAEAVARAKALRLDIRCDVETYYGGSNRGKRCARRAVFVCPACGGNICQQCKDAEFQKCPRCDGAISDPYAWRVVGGQTVEYRYMNQYLNVRNRRIRNEKRHSNIMRS